MQVLARLLSKPFSTKAGNILISTSRRHLYNGEPEAEQIYLDKKKECVTRVEYKASSFNKCRERLEKQVQASQKSINQDNLDVVIHLAESDVDLRLALEGIQKLEQVNRAKSQKLWRAISRAMYFNKNTDFLIDMFLDKGVDMFKEIYLTKALLSLCIVEKRHEDFFRLFKLIEDAPLVIPSLSTPISLCFNQAFLEIGTPQALEKAKFLHVECTRANLVHTRSIIILLYFALVQNDLEVAQSLFNKLTNLNNMTNSNLQIMLLLKTNKITEALQLIDDKLEKSFSVFSENMSLAKERAHQPEDVQLFATIDQKAAAHPERICNISMTQFLLYSVPKPSKLSSGKTTQQQRKVASEAV